MSGEDLAFYIFAIIAIAGGVLMLSMRKVVHMVMALVFTFLSIAGLYVLLYAEFVAVVQVLIYSGAVTIIMLFGIMLTKHNAESRKTSGRIRMIWVSAGVVAFFIVMFLGINHLSISEQVSSLYVQNTKKIGMSLYSYYIIPFEITSILLLVALVGAIVLAKRDKEEGDPHE